MAPFRKTFSRPVSSEWNPVPTSRSEPTRPSRTTDPVVGSVIRDRIFNSVLLPAPFRPITPSASPWRTSKDTSRSAQKESDAGPRIEPIPGPPRLGHQARRVRDRRGEQPNLRQKRDGVADVPIPGIERGEPEPDPDGQRNRQQEKERQRPHPQRRRDPVVGQH